MIKMAKNKYKTLFLILHSIVLIIHLITFLIVYLVELFGKALAWINNQIVDLGNYLDDKSDGAIDEVLNWIKSLIKKK
jgi:hypothetical protein